MESWGKALYKEIEAPARIVMMDVFSDADGNITEGMPKGITETWERLAVRLSGQASAGLSSPRQIIIFADIIDRLETAHMLRFFVYKEQESIECIGSVFQAPSSHLQVIFRH